MTGRTLTRRVVVAAAAGVAVFVSGWAAGHRPEASPTATPLPAAVAPVAAGVAGEAGEAGEAGYTVRSRAGVVAAARRATQLLSAPVVLDTPARAAVFAALVVPEAARRFEARYRRDLPTLRRSLGVAARGPVPGGVVMRSVSLGHHLASYSRERARVGLWTVLVLGNGVRVPPRAVWRAVEVTLAWTPAGWRVTDLTDTQGPTPALLGSPSPAGVFADGQAGYQPHEP